MRALRPSLSLTRKSIIQAAIDKADQALQEMASIPEGPAVIEQRSSANMPSQPATPTDPLTAVSSAVPPGCRSGGDAPKRGPQQRIVSPLLEHQQAEVDIARGAECRTAVDSAQGAGAGIGMSKELPRSMISPANGSLKITGKPYERKAAPCSSHPIEFASSIEVVLPGQVVLDESVSADGQHDGNEKKRAIDGDLYCTPLSAAKRSDIGGCTDDLNIVNHPLVKEASVGNSSDAVKELLSLKV